MFKLVGALKVIKDTEQVSEKFSKREFVINDEASMYPQEIVFQAAQDKCSMLDGFIEGEQVEVSFNLRGRLWTSPQGEDKYFNTLDAWKIEKIGDLAQKAAPKTPQAKPQQTEEAEDDLPF